MTSPIARLNDYGQSPWYDNITRDLLTDGGLAAMLRDDGIRGVTSNPTIFDKAMSSTDAYDDQLRELVGSGLDIEDVFWQLVVTDIGNAADVLRPVFEESGGGDGFVSIEVSPEKAHQIDETLEQVRDLRGRLDRPNILVKIPATKEGVTAIERAIGEGISVNVTLIFALERHGEVIEAYMSGLERFAADGGDLSTVASVASFFVSRVDTEIDRRLPEDSSLRGRAAVANAKLAYELFRERFAGERWEALAAKGARLQRPLWASTSTKNPAYSDTLYVDELIGPDTVNTLAQGSVDALRDHGDPQADTVTRDVDGAREVLAELAEVGVDYDDVTDTLEREGVASFAASFEECLATLSKRADEFSA